MYFILKPFWASYRHERVNFQGAIIGHDFSCYSGKFTLKLMQHIAFYIFNGYNY